MPNATILQINPRMSNGVTRSGCCRKTLVSITVKMLATSNGPVIPRKISAETLDGNIEMATILETTHMSAAGQTRFPRPVFFTISKPSLLSHRNRR